MVRESSLDSTGLSFALPIALRGTGRDDGDAGRLRILLGSFLNYFDMADLRSFSLVCPPEDMANVAAVLAEATLDGRFEVISEHDVCPELVKNPSTVSTWPRPNMGWYRQQLVKLSMHQHVSTTHYVVLDSDVICVRKFAAKDLVRDSRAICNVETAADYRRIYARRAAVVEAMAKQQRVDHAARVLRMERPDKYVARFYGETPVVFDTMGVAGLTNYLTTSYEADWQKALLDNLPWTEYPLYFQYLEATGQLEARYCLSHRNAVLRLDQSLWLPPESYSLPRTLADWPSEDVFDTTDDGFFVVLQSYLGHTAPEVAARLRGRSWLPTTAKASEA